MSPVELKEHILTVPEQIGQYFGVILEAAVELHAQGKLTTEQLRAYRKEFSGKEIAEIDQELENLGN